LRGERSQVFVAPWRWAASAAASAIGFALILAFHAVPVRAQVASELDVERIVRDVEIHGNASYKAKELRRILRTRGSSFWKPWAKRPLRSDYIRADRATLTAFYRRHGYLDARVDSVPVRPVGSSSRKWDVHFYLTEGPRAVVDTIRVEGTGPVSETEFRKALRFQAGSPLDLPIVQASRDSVVNTYADRGYVLARVIDSLEVRDNHRVAITYRVQPGPRVSLDRVLVEGTRKTKPSFVSREMLLRPGDVVRRSRLILSQQRIYDSGLYSDVQMELGPVDSSSHRAEIIVSVTEQKMGWIDAGIGYGTVDQLRLTGQWGQRNIFRSSMRFVATGRLGLRFLSFRLFPLFQDPIRVKFGDRRLDVALTHPWPLGVRLQTTLGAYTEDQPIIEKTDEFPLRAYGGSVVFATSFLRDTRSYTSYELRHVVRDSVTVAAGGVSYTTNRIGFTSERDTRADIFNPKGGTDLLGKIEFVTGSRPGAGGFANLGLQGSGYAPLRGGAVLAVRVRGGYIEPWGAKAVSDSSLSIPRELNEIPVEDRYRTGGASTVRGYLENELGSRTVVDTTGSHIVARGGQVLLLASAEVRFPLVWIISGAAFFDAGNVWERPEDMNLSRIFSFGGGAGYNDMRYSGGVGLRIGTPVGPIRFDYGWKIRSARNPFEPDLSDRRGEFHFSLGYPY
jgi:outer membrane protein insertion porin family